MDPHSDDESDRIDVRDGETSDGSDEGVWVTRGDVDDGVQAGDGGTEDVEEAERSELSVAGEAGTRV